jgi:hypothetical protein
MTSSSTSSLEAFLYGKKVISYIAENILTSDPSVDIEDKNIHRWYEGEDLTIDFLKDFLSVTDRADIKTIKNRYFDEINKTAWLCKNI